MWGRGAGRLARRPATQSKHATQRADNGWPARWGAGLGLRFACRCCTSSRLAPACRLGLMLCGKARRRRPAAPRPGLPCSALPCGAPQPWALGNAVAAAPGPQDEVVAPCWDMPDHTFGGQYARFMGTRGFLASGRPPCR